MKNLAGVVTQGLQIKSVKIEVDVEKNRFSVMFDNQKLDLDLTQVNEEINTSMSRYLHTLNQERIKKHE